MHLPVAALSSMVLHALVPASLQAEPPPAFGYIHLIIGAVVGIGVAALTIWFMVKPGEKRKDHAKRRILREETEGHAGSGDR